MFDPIDLLGSEKMILKSAQKMSKHFLDSCKLFLRVCKVRQNEKKAGQDVFFTGTVAIFSKFCILNNHLGVTEMIL